MAFLERVEIIVRKPAPIEAREVAKVKSNRPSHPPVNLQKSRLSKSVVGRTAKTRELIEISSPEATPPKQTKKGKAKSSVQDNKPSKRKASALESSEEEERRPAKSLAIPFKLPTKKSTPSSLQNDKKIHSPEAVKKKSRASLTSRKQVLSGPDSPHSIQYDGTKRAVRPKAIPDPTRLAKKKTGSSTHPGKKVSTPNLNIVFSEVLFISNLSGQRKVTKSFHQSQQTQEEGEDRFR